MEQTVEGGGLTDCVHLPALIAMRGRNPAISMRLLCVES